MSYLRSRPPLRNTIVSLARRKRQLPRHGAAKAASLWPARRDTASMRLAQRFKMTARCRSFARRVLVSAGFHRPAPAQDIRSDFRRSSWSRPVRGIVRRGL